MTTRLLIDYHRLFRSLSAAYVTVVAAEVLRAIMDEPEPTAADRWPEGAL